MIHRLVPHPLMPAKSVSIVTAQLERDPQGEFWLEFAVASGESLALPPAQKPGRADDLWQSTCFELFARSKGSDAYIELNFSPSFQWAAYTFSGYRAGRRDLPTDDLDIGISPAEDWFFLSIEGLPDLGREPLRLGLSAIIEEADGTKSYWALAHPAAEPDFHHPDSFALELPEPPSSPRT